MNKGRAIMAKVSPPDRMEKPIPKYTEKIAFPNRPNTMDGTAESISIDLRIIAILLLLFSANSARKRAEVKPTGMTTKRLTANIRRVEIIMGYIPPFLPPENGECSKKLNEKFFTETSMISPKI